MIILPLRLNAELMGELDGILAEKLRFHSVFKMVVQPQNASDGFAVANLSRFDTAQDRGQGIEPVLDQLVGLGLGDSRLEVFGEEDGHGFLEESWAGIKVERLCPPFGGVTSFFQEFALSGGEGVLAGIDASGGELEHVTGGCVAVLALEEDARFWAGAVDSKDDDGARVANDLANCGYAVWFHDVVASYVKDTALEYGLRGENLGGGGPPWTVFCGRLRFAGSHRYPILRQIEWEGGRGA